MRHARDDLIVHDEFTEADNAFIAARDMFWLATVDHLPAPDGTAPLAGWKRIDFIQPALPHYDQGRVNEAGGPLTIEEWGGKVVAGDREA